MRWRSLLFHRDCTTMTLNTTMSGKTFDDVVNYVSGVRKSKILSAPDNLKITELFLDQLNMRGHLEKLRFVHVAGTKGKGTTSAYTSAILQSYGFKVGLFVSPHITDVRERIMIGNALLPKDVFARYFFEMQDRIKRLAESESLITRSLLTYTNFFRFMFLLALHIFVEESVEVAVIEVGIGGRIDSTNVIMPEVSVITALGLDHTEVLGNTVEAIALEKAGIIKSGVICYTTPQKDYPSTLNVLKNYGCKVEAPVVIVNELTLPIHNWPSLSIGGSHAIENSKLGLLAARRIAGISPIQPLNEVERNVLQSMTFKGRSQVISITGKRNATFYFDGAHTFESLHLATCWFLEESKTIGKDLNPYRVLIFYTSRNPNYILQVFKPFLHNFSKVILAFVKNPASRRTDPIQTDYELGLIEVTNLTECWRKLYPEIPCLSRTTPFYSLQEILDLTLPDKNYLDNIQKPAQIFVTGSFFLLSDIMKLMKE